MVLIAQLATSGGRRAPLADVANQVFLNLVHELQAEGLGNKLIADMFGVSLRTYYDRVRRLSESATMRGRSLWEALLSHIRQQGTATRAQVLQRFRYDDDATVRSVLRDLATTGLIEVHGKGDATRYTANEAALASDPSASESLVWVAIYNARSLTATELAERVRLPADVLEALVAGLIAAGQVERSVSGTDVVYSSEQCVIGFDSAIGWEAALFDHYQALVGAMCAKLQGSARGSATDTIGGSTYAFDISDDHPLRDDVLGLLARFRTELGALRAKVEASAVSTGDTRVVFYLGQNVHAADTPSSE